MLHSKIEKNSIFLLIATILVISIGGMFEALPLFLQEATIEKVEGVRPYSPLELAGFKIYVREGCYNCHSQQIRPLRDEVERYGHYSLAAESMYDHPFQWGSKRTGPDLARIGGKYSDDWHRIHLINPRDVVPSSIMPAYEFLEARKADIYNIKYDMKVLRKLGVPYTDEMIDKAFDDAIAQANPDFISPNIEKRYPKISIRNNNLSSRNITEMDAIIAYLQVLGTMIDFKDYDPELRKTIMRKENNINPQTGIINSTNQNTEMKDKPDNRIETNIGNKTDTENEKNLGNNTSNGGTVDVELKKSEPDNKAASPSSFDLRDQKKEVTK